MQVQSFFHKHQVNSLILPLLGLGVSIILSIYLFQQTDFAHFMVLAKRMPVSLFFLLPVLYLILNAFRALRFHVLLSEKPLPFAILFPITLCHNFFVRTLPLMVGEFSYIALLRRYLKAPISDGIRSLFEARLFDLQYVVLGGVFGLLTMRYQLTGYVLGTLVLVGILIPANRILFAVLPKGVERIWTCILRICPWRHSTLLDSVGHKLGEISLQLDRFRYLRVLLKALSFTLCIYGINLGIHLLLLSALKVDQGLDVLLVVISIVMIASWFPFSLSGFGVIEASWAGSLVMFANMEVGKALSIGLFIHCCQVLMTILLGGGGFLLLMARARMNLQPADDCAKNKPQSTVLGAHSSIGRGECQ